MANGQPVVANAVKIAGEAVMPGASMLMEGRVVGGLLHTVAAGLAGALLGPLGVLLVVANSYSNSVNDQNLWQAGKNALGSLQSGHQPQH
jgi:hypothetical protein